MTEPAVSVSSTVAERRAAIQALPLCAEPLTAEEEAIFREIEAEVASGERGIPHAELPATLERIERALDGG